MSIPTSPETSFFAAATKALPGAGDLVYRLDALGSVCQCTDSLSAAHGINLGYARNAASFQMAESSDPSFVGGVTHTMRFTPATEAGMAFIRTEEGYRALPPGTKIPTESSGSTFAPTKAPSSRMVNQPCCF